MNMEKCGYSRNILSETELVRVFSNKTDAEIVAMYLDKQELSGLYYLLMVRYLRSLCLRRIRTTVAMMSGRS